MKPVDWKPIAFSDIEIGMKLRVKSLDWYEFYCDEHGDINDVECVFVSGMHRYCSMILTVKDYYEGHSFFVEEDGKSFLWSVDCFSEVVRDSFQYELEQVMNKEELLVGYKNYNPFTKEKNADPSTFYGLWEKAGRPKWFKVKPMEWYEKYSFVGRVRCYCNSFTPEMSKYCGKIVEFFEFKSKSLMEIRVFGAWQGWCMDMFSDYYLEDPRMNENYELEQPKLDQNSFIKKCYNFNKVNGTVDTITRQALKEIKIEREQDMNELAIQEAKAISANWNMVVFQAVNADNGDTYQNLFNKFLNEHDGSRIEYIKLLSDFIEFAQGQI